MRSVSFIKRIKEIATTTEPEVLAIHANLFKRSPVYNTANEALIELFFKEILWETLLVDYWQLFPSWEDAQPTVLKIKSDIHNQSLNKNYFGIKKAWLANQNMSLISILCAVGILSPNQITKSRRLVTSPSDTTWLCETPEELLVSLRVPLNKRQVTKTEVTKIGVKRKAPVYMYLKDQSVIQNEYGIKARINPPTTPFGAVINLLKTY